MCFLVVIFAFFCTVMLNLRDTLCLRGFVLFEHNISWCICISISCTHNAVMRACVNQCYSKVLSSQVQVTSRPKNIQAESTQRTITNCGEDPVQVMDKTTLAHTPDCIADLT